MVTLSKTLMPAKRASIVARNANGTALSKPATWTSSDSAIASVVSGLGGFPLSPELQAALQMEAYPRAMDEVATAMAIF